MAEVGVSAVAAFTEVTDRRLNPFNFKDSNGKPVSGVIPLNSRPVLGAGGFDVNIRQPFGAGRLSIAPEGTFGLGWSPNYSTMYWSATANAALNLGNGNARVIAKVGYGGYKVESDTAAPEVRHGAKLALELAYRLSSDFDLSSQLGVTVTPDGPQTLAGIGLRWLFDKRPQPPVDLDGSLGRQTLAYAEQILDQLEATATLPQLMETAAVGPAAALNDRLAVLAQMTHYFAEDTSYTLLSDVFAKLDKVKTALNHASNIDVSSYLSANIPLHQRMTRFKENQLAALFKYLTGILDEVQVKQCTKAATYLEDGDMDSAQNAVSSCAEKLTTLQTLFTKLSPLLTPVGQIDASTAQRKILCLLKAQDCTSDLDPQKTVPAMQKRLTPDVPVRPDTDKPSVPTKKIR